MHKEKYVEVAVNYNQEVRDSKLKRKFENGTKNTKFSEDREIRCFLNKFFNFLLLVLGSKMGFPVNGHRIRHVSWCSCSR